MTATITRVADAVVTELAGGTFSMPFTPVRSYRPIFDLKEMKTLHVTVVPRELHLAVLDRTRVTHEVVIDIGVQKKFTDEAEIDGLLGLVEEIVDFFKFRHLPDALWVRTENKPVISDEHIERLRQFTSLVSVVYKVVK